MTVQPIPDGYHTITPYLVASDAAALLTFLEEGLGATVHECMRTPDGQVMHAQAQVGDSRVMLGGARDEYPPMPTMLYLYVEDCDVWYQKALAAGGTSIQEPMDMFYGDRNAAVKDPCDNQWWFATHVEDVSDEEIAARAAAQGQGQGGS